MKALINIALVIGLLFSTQYAVPEAHASSAQSHIDHPSLDRKDPRTRGKGKKKGLYKHSTERNNSVLFGSAFAHRFDPPHNNGNSHGKKKGHKKNHKQKHKHKRHHAKKHSAPVVPAPKRLAPETSRQPQIQCVIIERPKETRVEYRTRTVTEQVLYGAGILALGAVAAGLFSLLFGFGFGWRRASNKAFKDEKEFISSVLHNDKE